MPNNLLIYNACCPFCENLAIWTQEQVGKDVLEICGNNKIPKEITRLFRNYDFEKDVHLIVYSNYSYFIASKGKAISEAFGLRNNKYYWIHKWYNKSIIFRYLFEKGYLFLKKYKYKINDWFYDEI